MDAVNAEIIDIKDFIYEEAEIPIGSITLDISPDNKIHYQSLFADSELKDGILTIINYYGKILVPKHAGINISNTLKNIDGKVASPTNIKSRGDITLSISKDSNLELCLAATGRLAINNRIITSNHTDMYTYGSDYDNFNRRYWQNAQTNKDIKNKLYDINVCMHYSLINIHNDGERITLEYYAPPRNSMEQEVEWAKIVEDYKKVKHVHKILLSLNNAGNNILSKN